MGYEFDGAILGEAFKGYRFKITGGNDKDGFTMKQGVLKNGRVRLLLSKGTTCYIVIFPIKNMIIINKY